MKLYFSRGACSLAVRIMIHEVDLASEFESVDLKTKKTETGENFLNINPKGAVPTLLTNEGQILTENAVILQYLAEYTKATQLLPTPGNFYRYRVLEWLNFVSSDIHKSFGLLFNPNLPADTKEKIMIPLLKNKLHFVNRSLENKNFLMGENFTLPDAYLFVMLTWAHHFHIPLEEKENLKKYFNQLIERPSIKKSLEEEKLSATAQ